MLPSVRASAAWLFALVPFACVPDIDLTGRPCPCADGYTCDAATNTCVTALPSSSGSGASGSTGGTGGAGAGTGAAAGGGTGTGGVLPDGFAFRRRLTFDNGGRDEDLIDFPVLVVLDPSRVRYDAVQPGGADVRFTDEAQMILPHEIERWEPGGVSFIWVRVPRIAAGSTTDSIFFYYGDPSASDGQAREAVWADDQAVYHLDEALDDSSAQHFDGVNAGSADAPGVIGRARSFSGPGKFVNLGDDRPFLASAPGFTLSLWLRPDPSLFGEAVVFGTSIDSGGAPTGQSRAQILLDNDSLIRAGARTSDNGTPGTLVELTGGAAPPDAWTWVAVVANFADDTMAIYINGALATSDSGLGFAPLSASSPSTRTTLGIDENHSSLPFRGLVDETRLSRDARSAPWISAQYASMTDTFITFGPEEPL